jgi:hypothetical protein
MFGKSIAEDLKEIGCDVAAQAANRFGLEMPSSPEAAWKISDIKPRAMELQNVIFDEMQRHLDRFRGCVRACGLVYACGSSSIKP